MGRPSNRASFCRVILMKCSESFSEPAPFSLLSLFGRIKRLYSGAGRQRSKSQVTSDTVKQAQRGESTPALNV